MISRERASAIAFAAVIAYLLLVGGTPAGMATPEIRVTTLALATVVFAVWVVAAIRAPAWRPRSIFLPGFVGGIAVLAASALMSRSPRTGLEGVAQATILVAAYLLLVELIRRPLFRDRVLFATTTIAVFVSAGYVFTVAFEWAAFWQVVGHFAMPPLRPDLASFVYFNPATTLAMAVLLAGPVVGEYWGNGAGRVLSGCAIALAFIAVVLTGTRAGWLAVATSVAIAAIAGLSVGGSQGASTWLRSNLTTSRGRAIALAGAGIVLVGSLSLLPGIVRRLEAGGEEVRGSFYIASLRMFAEQPIAGVGPGMWQGERSSHTAQGEVDYHVVDAHNFYLQGLAETGLAGAIAASVGALLLFWLIRDGLRDQNRDRRRWAIVALISCAYLGVHQVFVSFQNVPAVLLGAAIPVAVLDASATGRRRNRALLHPDSAQTRILQYASTLALAAALGIAWWSTPATLLASEAARSANVGDWQRADQLAQRARELDPELPQYGLLEGLTAAHTGDETRAKSFLTAEAEATDLPEAWVNVSALRLRMGDANGAKAALAKASRLGLQHPAVAVAIADLFWRMGDAEGYLLASASAIALVPSLAADPWWMEDPGRGALFSRIVAAALEIAGPEGRWQIRLMASDAKALDAAADSRDPERARMLILAWQGDAAAADAILDKCSIEPLDSELAWCARIASRIGLTEEAARFRRLCQMLRVTPDTVGELRIFDALSKPSVAGDIAYKASGRGRNPGLWDLLVPGVLRVEIVS